MIRGWNRLVLAGLPALFVLGCPGTVNPAAVLEGVWRLIFDTPGDLEGYDIRLTFNASGELTGITAESPQGGTASLAVTNSTTTVEENEVTVTVPTQAGDRSFEGTLSADGNSIDGEFSQSIELPSGDLDVTLPDSAATLERIETCDAVADCDDEDACTTDTCTDSECGHAPIACAAVGTCPEGCNAACTAGACTD